MLADFKRHKYFFAAFCDECPRYHQFDINELIANSPGQILILIIKPCCNEVGKRAQNLLALNARYPIAMRDGDDHLLPSLRLGCTKSQPCTNIQTGPLKWR
ncbi:uncharacterized protein METZ01_LOCUS465932 [marine metagenome]|uniref:Uncharacterized protein n=1 Tax=marine metagenome TaxID=408172 RepID=A0A383B0Z2_9ZZZZ